MPDHSPETPTNHPQSVGRYQIIRRLGEGGMGSVFLAQDTILRRDVALKLPLIGTENDPEVRERFLREARSAATLDHPYICRVYDADLVDGRLYLAMAYIEGKSLADLVRAEGIPPRQVVALVGKLAIAMNEAHLKGVVHRDLKPRNVMIRSVGTKREPVIVDFGLARLETVEDVRMTKTGQVMGTPAYMAPEQLRGKPDEIGPACDIYSLGVILYELLTGQLPFSGPYPVLVAQILTQMPLPPSSHRQGLDPMLDEICLKAMAKEISQRYATMMDLATALTGYLRAAPSISQSGRPIESISRPMESDSIPTGADTLVSQLLGRNVDVTQSLISGIKVDEASLKVGPKSEPMPVSAGKIKSKLEIIGEYALAKKLAVASSLIIGLAILAGIFVVIFNAGTVASRSRTQELLSSPETPKKSPVAKKASSPKTPNPAIVKNRPSAQPLAPPQETKSPQPPSVDRRETSEPAQVVDNRRPSRPKEDDSEISDSPNFRTPTRRGFPLPGEVAESPVVDAGSLFGKKFDNWVGLGVAGHNDPPEDIFRMEPGGIRYNGKQGRIYLRQPSSNFSFKFEYTLPDADKADHSPHFPSVFIRCTDVRGFRIQKANHQVANVLFALRDHSGYENGEALLLGDIHLDSTQRGVSGSLQKRTNRTVIALATWNSVEVRCQNEVARFFVNGRELNRVICEKDIIAYPGFHSFQTDIRIRNVRLDKVADGQ